ncbi:MAG: tyrosine-type recombinase/integrase [Lachnospiraceae bacterium]|nr:tyrosine-type recombinase/integrase [Lachnospiraceae bacterium]
MSTTEPIRDQQKLQLFKNYYQNEKPNIRNYTMIVIGLNTALRISDILNLTYDEIYQNNKVQEHITIKERKTGKENRILLNYEVRIALTKYRQELVKTEMYQKGNPYLFPSPKKSDSPLSRSQAYRMITAAADAVGIEGHISCHSLRKTFGYHAWKQGNDPIVIMVIFNHSSLSITKRYLCIEQDDKDNVYRNIYQNDVA